MRSLMRAVVGLTLVALVGTICLSLAMSLDASRVKAAPQAAEEEAPEPAAPEGQTYIGVKKCAACHFEQFMKWKKEKHSKTFDLLPAEYQTNEVCLGCHTTGYGTETGYKGPDDTNLKGTTCEACHGPGSKHEEVCQAYAKKKLTPEEEKIARDSIWKIRPGNICIKCHITKGHHESKTPKELRTK